MLIDCRHGNRQLLRIMVHIFRLNQAPYIVCIIIIVIVLFKASRVKLNLVEYFNFYAVNCFSAIIKYNHYALIMPTVIALPKITIQE